MNKKGVLLFIIFIITGIAYYYLTPPISTNYEEKVTRIIDGDTVYLEDGTKIRLKGINTPEKNQPFFQEAKDFLEKSIQDKTVKIVDYGPDKYGRTLAYIFLEDQNINSKILKEGLATIYFYDIDIYQDDLKSAEKYAKENELGLWKKSSDFACLELINLKYTENGNRCTNSEVLEIKNSCNKTLNIIIKDDANHIFNEEIKGNEIFKKNFSCTFNDDGDSLYIKDQQGLLMFFRY